MVTMNDGGAWAEGDRAQRAGAGGQNAPATTSNNTSSAPAGAGPTRMADNFASFLGVNVKTGSNGVWGQHAQIKAELQKLGVRHLRTRLYNNRPSQYTYLRDLAAAGVRSDLVAGDPTGSGGTPEQLVSVAASQLGGTVDSFEGVNEWNFKGGSNWAAEVRAHQQRLYRAVHANSKTAQIPVLGPAISANVSNLRSQIGNLSAYLDYGNGHLYPGGYCPSRIINDQLASMRIISGNKPAMFTETGYHNALNDPSGHRPATETVAGIYGPRLLAEHFFRGEARIYIYDMADDKPNPSLNDHEDHLGLLRNDLSEKPIFGSIRNLLRLTSDPGPSFTTRSLNYSITGAPSDLRQVLLQKRNGQFLLLLWRDVSIWDPMKKVNVSVSAKNVGVRLARSSTVGIYRPSSSSSPKAVMQTSSPTVSIGGDLVVMQIS